MNNNSSFENELNTHGRIVYTNVGVSMMPLVKEGRDIIVIEKYTTAPCKYDVILFRRPGVKGRGEYVLHRILKVYKDNKFLVVGDNCTSGETVDGACILGKLTRIHRDGKDIDFTKFSHKLYIFFVCRLYPARIVYLHTKNFIGYLFGAAKSIIRRITGER